MKTETLRTSCSQNKTLEFDIDQRATEKEELRRGIFRGQITWILFGVAVQRIGILERSEGEERGEEWSRLRINYSEGQNRETISCVHGLTSLSLSSRSLSRSLYELQLAEAVRSDHL